MDRRSLRIMVVDDHALFRKGIISLLSRQPEFDVVGECGDGAEAVMLAASMLPDLILMDIRMPGVSGTEAMIEIKRDLPEVRVVMLSAYEDEDDLLRSVNAGADGVLSKNLPPDQLFASIKSAHRGESPVDPSMTGKLLELFRKKEASCAPEHDEAQLSAREIEVLECVAEGMTNQEIASSLYVSVGTVKTHLHNVYRKLGAENRAQAVALGKSAGLLQSSLEDVPAHR